MIVADFFDYIYYRVAKAYFKWDGRDGATGIIAVGMIQGVVFLFVAGLFMHLFLTEGQELRFKEVITPKQFAGVVMLVFIAFNYFKYRKRYDELNQKWENEPKSTRRRNGILVVISMIAPFLLFGIRLDHIPKLVQ